MTPIIKRKTNIFGVTYKTLPLAKKIIFMIHAERTRKIKILE